MSREPLYEHPYSADRTDAENSQILYAWLVSNCCRVNELDLNPELARSWFVSETAEPYTLVRVGQEAASSWTSTLRDAVRRCYLSDQALVDRAHALEAQLGGTFESRQASIITSKLPDPSSTMAGDFGEILIYTYQAACALPKTAFGPKKWRLKHDRTKPAPGSDVVHFILPSWPEASDQDELLCAEVKMKSTAGATAPIQAAIAGCTKDRTSRLSRTLQWLKEKALTEDLGQIQIAHLERYIKATDYPPAIKKFRAVAVVCEALVAGELAQIPEVASSDYELVVVAVPNLHAVYNAVFEVVKNFSLPPQPPA